MVQRHQDGSMPRGEDHRDVIVFMCCSLMQFTKFDVYDDDDFDVNECEEFSPNDRTHQHS